MQFDALRKRDSSASLATEEGCFRRVHTKLDCGSDPANAEQSGRRIHGSGLGNSLRFSIVGAMLLGALVGGALTTFKWLAIVSRVAILNGETNINSQDRQ